MRLGCNLHPISAPSVPVLRRYPSFRHSDPFSRMLGESEFSRVRKRAHLTVFVEQSTCRHGSFLPKTPYFHVGSTVASMPLTFLQKQPVSLNFSGPTRILHAEPDYPTDYPPGPEYTDTLRVPPHSIQAEQSVLGGVMLTTTPGIR